MDRQPTWSATGYTRREIFFKVFISGSLPLSVHTYYIGYFAIFLLENRGNHTFSEPQMGKHMLQLDVTTWANVSDKKREAGCLVSMALDCSKTSLYPLLRRWGRGVLISSLRISFWTEGQRVEFFVLIRVYSVLSPLVCQILSLPLSLINLCAFKRQSPFPTLLLLIPQATIVMYLICSLYFL